MIFTIAGNKRINENTFDMRLLAPVEFTGKPGQFLHISCGDGNMLRRPISICGCAGNTVRIVYAVVGDGTRYLSNMKAGETVDALGPLGNGFPFGDNIPTLLAGGGLGTPPMLFCQNEMPNTHAVLGFRNKDAVILEDEFSSVQILTDDGSKGEKGYPHEAVEKLLKTGAWERVFACGPKPMLNAIARACAGYGVKCYVSLEERMACGVGACLVCACETADGSFKRVCKDGPVFDASTIYQR